MFQTLGREKNDYTYHQYVCFMFLSFSLVFVMSTLGCYTKGVSSYSYCMIPLFFGYTVIIDTGISKGYDMIPLWLMSGFFLMCDTTTWLQFTWGLLSKFVSIYIYICRYDILSKYIYAFISVIYMYKYIHIHERLLHHEVEEPCAFLYYSFLKIYIPFPF